MPTGHLSRKLISGGVCAAGARFVPHGSQNADIDDNDNKTTNDDALKNLCHGPQSAPPRPVRALMRRLACQAGRRSLSQASPAVSKAGRASMVICMSFFALGS
eukprot:TRINITY_DN23883_c1_g1_i3.p1 TRINITY_DN23883_c1_g1~~TRINITY_DN23883_c1_g1_i3.p1  ORF type:complete len:114 (-),score=2.85 TRINITY_DN23883_c1_g1_i3:109-417(-)